MQCSNCRKEAQDFKLDTGQQIILCRDCGWFEILADGSAVPTEPQPKLLESSSLCLRSSEPEAGTQGSASPPAGGKDDGSLKVRLSFTGEL